VFDNISIFDLEFRGVVTGVAGVASTTTAFEKIKGKCIRMLH